MSKDRSQVVPVTSIADTTDDKSKGSPKNIGRGPPKDDSVFDGLEFKKTNVFSLFEYASPAEKFGLVVGILCAIIVGLLIPSVTFVYKSLINEMSRPDPDFSPMIKLFCTLGVLAFIFAGTYTYIFEAIGERQLLRLKQEFFMSLVRQDISWYDVSDPGRLATRVTEELATYREGNGVRVAQIIQYVTTLLGGWVVGLINGPILALIVIACFPLMGFAGARVGKALMEMVMGAIEAHAEAGAIAEEALSNIRTVQAFGKEEEFTKRYDSRLVKGEKRNIIGNAKFGTALGFMFFAMYFSFILAYYFGVHFLANSIENHDNKWNAGTVMMVCMSTSMGSFSIGQLATPLKAVFNSIASLSKVLAVAQRKPTGIDSLSDSGVKVNKNDLTGRVTFSDIDFSYPAKPLKKVLNKISFTMEAGKTTALVGASGSGKSSCAQLLMRYYDPSTGSIAIDGTDLKTVNIHSWREIIGIVQQEPKLFADSIYNNIKLGKPDATKDEVIAAAKAANAHDFIMQFPDGYETDVGQAGGQLSGGQKQRIAIARAIIRDPKVLILDEATSALDNQSEKVVQKALDDMMAAKPRTTLVIAHRLTTIRKADKIVVFQPREDGSVIMEEGSHDELIRITGGIYRNFVETHERNAAKEADEVAEAAVVQRVVSNVSDAIHRQLSQSAADRATNSGALFNNSVPTTAVDATSLVSKTELITQRSEKLSLGQVYRRSWGMVSDLLYWVIPGMIGGIIRGMSNPLYGRWMGSILSIMFLQDPVEMRHEIWSYCVKIFILGVIQVPAVTLAFGSFGRLQSAAIRRSRKLFFNSLLYQDGEFFDAPSRTTGALITSLTAHTSLFKEICGASVQLATENATCFIVAFILAFTTNWRMALGMCAGYLILIPGFYMEAKYRILDQAAEDAREAAKETTKANSAGHLLTETLSSIRVVQALAAEKVIYERYNNKLGTNFTKGMKKAIGYAIGNSLSTCALYFVSAIGYGIGGALIKNGTATTTDVFRVFSIMFISGQGMAIAAAVAKDQAKAVEAAREIFAIADRKHGQDVRDDKKGRVNGNVSLEGADIHFEGLKFFYPTRSTQRVYNGVNFTLPAGKTTALVGASGSGKSTIVQLLERYYGLHPGLTSKDRKDIICDGKIIVETKDGRRSDLRDIPVSEWRDQIGLVGQEPSLFLGSVSDNIALGASSNQVTTQEEIVEAATLSNATEFISRLQGAYDSDVGRYGGQLSGGQKQRVAIARAIIRDPKLLILDEATSALDNESERVVQAALDELLEKGKKRTTLVIAHRLTTIRKADKIVVFKPTPEGSFICEEGTHDELMSIQNGEYAKLVKAAEAVEKK